MDCQSVRDDGILELCRGCREIRVLELIFCDGISDEALASACEYLIELTSINIFGCGGIGCGSYTVFSDLARLPKLKYANLVGTYIFYFGVESLLNVLGSADHVRWTEEVLELVLEGGRFPNEGDRTSLRIATPAFVTIEYHRFRRIYYDQEPAW